jgi:L-ascorbate metabolism protein UlaG (beta-lactamase superfamily)
MNSKFVVFLVLMLSLVKGYAQPVDTIKTNRGNLVIHLLGHGTLMLEYNGKVIHIDPFSNVADYKNQPKADLILITHQHYDHLDSTALGDIYKEGTTIYWTQECQKSSKFQRAATVLKNGDKCEYEEIGIEVVPAYNIVNKRADGTPFHPKDEGNGYVLTFGDKRVYIAGDTENIPEMKGFGKVDIAFLPVNLPYTMSPEMLLDAVRMIKPLILYPYHYGKTDMQKVLEILKEENKTKIIIRKSN